MSKLLSLEEEPPSLAQAEQPARKSSLKNPDLNGSGAPVQLASAARARFVVSATSNEFRKRHFPGVKTAEWNDWRWQNRNRIRSLEQLERIICVTAEERAAILRHEGPLPIGVTPYYMSLIDAANPQQGADFRAGKTKAFNALVGQVMKATKGQANPQHAAEVLRRSLG